MNKKEFHTPFKSACGKLQPNQIVHWYQQPITQLGQTTNSSWRYQGPCLFNTSFSNGFSVRQRPPSDSQGPFSWSIMKIFLPPSNSNKMLNVSASKNLLRCFGSKQNKQVIIRPLHCLLKGKNMAKKIKSIPVQNTQAGTQTILSVVVNIKVCIMQMS